MQNKLTEENGWIEIGYEKMKNKRGVTNEKRSRRTSYRRLIVVYIDEKRV